MENQIRKLIIKNTFHDKKLHKFHNCDYKYHIKDSKLKKLLNIALTKKNPKLEVLTNDFYLTIVEKAYENDPLIYYSSKYEYGKKSAYILEVTPVKMKNKDDYSIILYINKNGDLFPKFNRMDVTNNLHIKTFIDYF
jgi:hypothetical protein